MVSRIIKQGTARTSMVQRFFFSENAMAAPHPTERSDGMEPTPIMTAVSDSTSIGVETGASDPELAIREQAAYQKGLLHGEKTAREAVEKKLEASMKVYAESIGEIRKLRSTLFSRAEREVVQLALAVAKKIVHREIRIDRDIVQMLVHVALSHVSEKSAVTICLNPEDHGYLLERQADFSQSEGRDITFLADKSIERGGCLIQTNSGDIDARIEEKFREVEHSFFEGVN